MQEYCHIYASPVGALTLTLCAQGLTALHFAHGNGTPQTRSAQAAQSAVRRARALPCASAEMPVLRQAVRWLDAYFALPITEDSAAALLLSPLPPMPPLLPLAGGVACGTLFQREVWGLLSEIAHGKCVTYGALARTLAARGRICDAPLWGGQEHTRATGAGTVARWVYAAPSGEYTGARRVCVSAQAVGGAVGRNPLGIFIPCHRVVGAGGGLTGFAGGLTVKKWLLRHEGHSIEHERVSG